MAAQRQFAKYSHLVPLVIVFEATGLEIALKRNINIDHELKINGIANLIVGLCSGTICHLDLANTLISHKAGATSHLAGIFAALSIGAILLIGGGLLAYLPTFVVVALTLSVGIELILNQKIQPCTYLMISIAVWNGVKMKFFQQFPGDDSDRCRWYYS